MPLLKVQLSLLDLWFRNFERQVACATLALRQVFPVPDWRNCVDETVSLRRSYLWLASTSLTLWDRERNVKPLEPRAELGDDIVAVDPSMMRLLETARVIAGYRTAVLVTGE